MVEQYCDEFDTVEQDVPDKILELFVKYMKDDHADKVNLGIGAYRDNGGSPYIFEVVKKAEQKVIAEQTNKEYLGVEGIPAFREGARKLLFGEDSPLVTNGKVASCQTIAGSGALSMGMEFLRRTKPACFYTSAPTWANHSGMIKQAGFTERKLRYYDPETKSLQFDAYLEDLSKATHGSIVLLQACAHNPTGVDPSEEQWRAIAKVMKARNLFPFFDCAYQGFGSGNVETDAYSIRHFIEAGFQMVITQSFSKIMGLYGERVGCLHVVCKDAESAGKVLSRVKSCVRAYYSSPPKHGALIASEILNNPELKAEWLRELKDVGERILAMRSLLKEELVKAGAPGNWDHVTN